MTVWKMLFACKKTVIVNCNGIVEITLTFDIHIYIPWKSLMESTVTDAMCADG